MTGECYGVGVDEITVEDGLITRYEWGVGYDVPCDPERVAEIADSGMSVEFTGDECVYSGPTQFDLGDEVDISLVDVGDEPSEVGIDLQKVVDGTTVAEARERGVEDVLPPGVDEEDGPFIWSARIPDDRPRVLAGTLDTAGTWLVFCFVFDGGPDADELPVATLEVE